MNPEHKKRTDIGLYRPMASSQTPSGYSAVYHRPSPSERLQHLSSYLALEAIKSYKIKGPHAFGDVIVEDHHEPIVCEPFNSGIEDF